MLDSASPRRRSYLMSIARQRCPDCSRGLVYRHAMQMNARCPVCAARFDREPGYFTGAIYIGIWMFLPLLLLGMYLLMRFVPSIPAMLTPVVAMAAALPLLPLVLRLSRVFWLGLGRDFSPDDRDERDPPQSAASPAPPPPVGSDAAPSDVREYESIPR